MNYEIILEDVFNIANRLKSIHPNYRLKWNKIKKRYELFFKNGMHEVRELIVPFQTLDSRTIDFVNKTRIENSKMLLMELEKNNERITLQQEKQIKDQTSDEIKNMANYIFKKGNFDNLKFDYQRTKWV